MRSNQNYQTLLVGMQNGTPTLENSLAASYGVKHTLTYDLAIPLLGFYPREIKTFVHTKSYT